MQYGTTPYGTVPYGNPPADTEQNFSTPSAGDALLMIGIAATVAPGGGEGIWAEGIWAEGVWATGVWAEA